MEPVIYKNGEFMEIVIPANTEITSEMLLNNYGIHAVIEDSASVTGSTYVGGGGETSNLTYPYAFFHWFFSFFSLSNKGDKSNDDVEKSNDDVEKSNDDVVEASPSVDTPSDETKVVDETNVDTNVEKAPSDEIKVDAETKVVFEASPSVDTPSDETNVVDEASPSVDTPSDETKVVDEITPSDETNVDTNVEKAPSDETPSDETPSDETKVGETPSDDSKKDIENPVVDNSKSKYMKIIIKSIDGVRSW